MINFKNKASKVMAIAMVIVMIISMASMSLITGSATNSDYTTVFTVTVTDKQTGAAVEGAEVAIKAIDENTLDLSKTTNADGVAVFEEITNCFSGEVSKVTVTYTVTATDYKQVVIAEENAIEITDAVGNIDVELEDTVKPVITEVTGNPTDWTKDDITLEVVCNDADAAEYKMNDGEWQTAKTFTVSANGEYKFTVKDTAGNISDEATVSVTFIDKEAPTLSVEVTPLEWTNTSVIVKAIANDSGVGSVEFSIDDVNWSANSEFTVDKNSTVTVSAKDALGNKISAVVDVDNIDKDAPTITELKPSTTEPTNKDITVTVAATDENGSGVNGYKMNDGEWQTKNEFTVTENGKYTFYVKDTAGNTTSKELEVKNIDKDAPTITELNPSTTDPINTDITVTVLATYEGTSEIAGYKMDNGEWQTDNVFTVTENGKYTFYVKDTAGNTTSKELEIKNIDKTPASAKWQFEGNKEDAWSEFITDIAWNLFKNTSATVIVFPEDEQSGIASVEYYKQYSSADGVTLEGIENNTQIQWNSAVKDTNNDKHYIYINLADYTNKKVVVYVKVTNNAGTASYFMTDGIIFDNIAPDAAPAITTDKIIDIQLSETEVEGLYEASEDINFNLTVEDNSTNAIVSGIKDITVSIVDSKNNEFNKEVVKLSAKKSEIDKFNSENYSAEFEKASGEFYFNPIDFALDSNHLQLKVVVTDYAGNTNEAHVNFAVDQTAPEINVDYEDVEITNGKYIGNHQNRKATITVTELNFVNDKVVITATRDGEILEIAPDFKANGTDANGDNNTWTMDIDYADYGEGDYTFDITCSDKAGNAAKDYVEDVFVIDNTDPVIKVSFDNNDVRNGKYFAADRTATVTITERNFKAEEVDWSGVTLSLDGAALTAPVATEVKSDDTTYERVYTISFAAEGDYTFKIDYTDLAGNVADTYVVADFTVDKTAPALDITGVADKSANNGTVAPVVTYSDINFNKDAVTITLSGANNGTVNYAAAYADITHGQTYTYENFKKVQSVDDIYTLTAKLTDMAGNETEKAITFSANRFGSVYSLEQVEGILGKYLQNEQDVVFTETNVDSLDREGIILKLTKNGTPADLVEGTDYTVELTGGNGQWSVYKYTVNKALFAEDGTYSISVYSKDAAGNVNENIDEAKEAEISFATDKTKPVIVPVDFENGKQYAVDSKTVTVEIKDNLALETVKIYLNGKEIEFTANGENYTFTVPKSNSKQDVKFVATDAAGNEETIEIKGFLVNANIFVRWYNNTPLFIGSIVGVVVLALGATAFIVFKKKKA